MNNSSAIYPFICVVGAPRSGTTVLGDVLSKHPDIGYLFEPYFVWDHHIGPGVDDLRTESMASPEICSWIRQEFGIYLKKTDRKLFLDKSPFSSFRIPFVNKVFPHGKFVHILRDGRDVAVSTNRKWLERVGYTNQGHYRKFASEVWDKLRKRPFLRTKFRAIAYELRHNVKFGLKDFYAAYYAGKPGWGVRYPGFEDDLARYSLLQFNALQWLRSVQQIEIDLKQIPQHRHLTIRYEEFLANPNSIVSKILDFSGLENSHLIDVSHVRPDKQQTSKASHTQLDEIIPLIRPKLESLGYLETTA